jgi:hypothetical protein
MRLAEALAERADCQVRLAELHKRLTRVVRVQEGESPAEDSAELLVEVDRLLQRQLQLISAINRTNARTQFDNRRTISDVIAERDMTAKHRDLLSAVAEAASVRQDRYSKSEVKFVATLSVATLQKQIDNLSKQYRTLDTRLQELNWSTELI